MDVPDQPQQEPRDADPQSNVDRLLEHLAEDSLAAVLVSAARDAAEGVSPADAMKTVIDQRLQQAQVPHDAAED